MIPEIIYEDKYILAVHKPVGLPSQTKSVSQADVVSHVQKYLAESRASSGKSAAGKLPFIGMINRLDQPVEGIVLMALNSKTAARLTEKLRNGEIRKRYYAAVLSPDTSGASQEPRTAKIETDQGFPITLTDYIFHDKKNNFSSIVTPDHSDAKRAELKYSIIGSKQILAEFSAGHETAGPADRILLADIDLITGRHHQIRVQMAHAGLPLIGDTKYGTDEACALAKQLKISGVALCAYELSFTHPVTDDIITLRVKPRSEWYGLFIN
ncbi:MAG: RluA family pseudouridine synthase [Lachnospiraceae bacterium]|nr:RluA family pseudouridine synthase [Lachnospiraceae bacterium]